MKRVLIILFLFISFTGCKGEYCAPDFSSYKGTIWEYDLETGEVTEKQRIPIENGEYYTVGFFKFHGFDEKNRFLFYSKDTNTYPDKEYFKVDLITSEQEAFALDSVGENYELSPDGKNFVYNRNNDESYVWIQEVKTGNRYAIVNDTIFRRTRPKWINNEEISYSNNSILRKVSLKDRSQEILLKLELKFVGRYDLLEKNESILVSGYKEEDDGSEHFIYLKRKASTELLKLDSGTNPKFFGENFATFERGNNLLKTDFERTSILYSGDELENDLRDYALSSEQNKVIINKDGNLLSISFLDGAIESFLEAGSFNPENKGNLTDATTRLAHPFFSNDGQKLYFISVTEYYSNGC